MRAPRRVPSRRARLRSIAAGVALVIGSSCKGCGCFEVPSCNFSLQECQSDADCPQGEVCASGFGFSSCELLVPCVDDVECGPCEQCVPDSGGGSICKQLLGCSMASSASGDFGGAGSGSSDASSGSMSRELCVPGAPPELVADGIGAATALAADDTRIYWVGDGEVRAVSKHGGAFDVLATGAYLDVVARGSDQLLFADASGVWTLLDGDPMPALLAPTSGPTHAIAAVGGATSGMLAWSTHEAPPPHRVFAAPLPLPGTPVMPTVVVDLADASAEAPVAVDGTALFYADGPSVHAVDASGDAVLYTGGTNVDALTASGGAAWFVADGRIVRAIPGAGASSVAFAPGAVGGLAVDGEIYWAVDATDGAPMIWKIDPVRGLASVVVSAGGGEDPRPRSLLVDASCVYWIASGDGRIFRSRR